MRAHLSAVPIKDEYVISILMHHCCGSALNVIEGALHLSAFPS